MRYSMGMGKSKIRHNARDRLGHELVDCAFELLSKVDWPFERIEVRIDFGARVGAHSDTKVALEDRGGHAFGEATVFYNALSMHQRCMSFFQYVLPHELAHVLSITGCEQANVTKGTKFKIKPHDKEFHQAHEQLSRFGVKSHKDFSGWFDVRPIRLVMGGRAVLSSEGKVHVFTEGEAQKALDNPSSGYSALAVDEVKKVEPRLVEQVRWLLDEGYMEKSE